MEIIYISSMFEDQVIKRLYKKGQSPNYAANKYHQLLCKGLAENNVFVNAYLTLPISGTNCKKKIIRVESDYRDNLLKEYIPLINIKGIKQMMLFINAFLKVVLSKKRRVIIYDPLVMPASFGAVLGTKVKGYSSVAIITDLPEHIHRKANGVKCVINNKLVDQADAYVFLTKEMDSALNPKHKPYIVLEGHVDLDMRKTEHLPLCENEKRIIYAGGLKKIYGIEDLVNAFLNCCKKGEELHIYGSGEYEGELINLASINPCVKYHGSCPNKEVVKAELEATLLVNPRTSKGEFTKYSFPSKILEYMVSGTPVLMAKLPGIPDEYDSYVYYFNDNDFRGLEKALRKVLDKDSKQLQLFGNYAKEFVLKEKNHIQQAKRIIDFLEKLGEY